MTDPDTGERILYDLYVHDPEWPLDDEETPDTTLPQHTSVPGDVDTKSLWSRIYARVWSWPFIETTGYTISQLIPRHGSVPQAVRRYMGAGPHWCVSVSPSARTLAILTSSGVVMRHEDDDYTEDRHKLLFDMPDPHPKWARAAWRDEDVLAVASSDGSITILNNECHVVDKMASITQYGVAGVAFHGTDLLVVDYSGFCVVGNITQNTGSYHGGSVSACAYHDGILAVAGVVDDVDAYSLSFWRIGSEFELTFSTTSKMVLPRWPSLPSWLGGTKKGSDTVPIQMSFSPDGTMLAMTHGDGSASVWRDHELMHKIDDGDTVQVEWWRNDGLIVASSAGSVSVLAVPGWHNILGSAPEQLQPHPIISSSHENRFFILEYEQPHTRRPATQSTAVVWRQVIRQLDHAFYEWTPGGVLGADELDDGPPLPKWGPAQLGPTSDIVATYRLLSLCKTTPEALLRGKLAVHDYDAALVLAESFGLDTDSVYQSRWTSSHSVGDIDTCLEHIRDKEWVVNECMTCILAEPSATKTLLEYGITSAGDDRGKVMTMLRYCDRLDTLLEIRSDGYNVEAYRQFRDADLIQVSVAAAVTQDFWTLECVLKRHAAVVWPARLVIFSCIPETTPVSSYAHLLPGADQSDDIGEPWRQAREWEHDIYSNDDSVCVDGATKTMRLSSDMIAPLHLSPLELTSFYTYRAREIDDRSGATDNAFALVSAGISVGVTGLDALATLLDEVCTFVYNDDIEVSLSSYERMSDLGRMKLLTSISPIPAARIKAFIDRRNDDGLFRRLLVDLAINGHLDRVVVLVKTCKFVDLSDAAIDAAYVCGSQEWPLYRELFDALTPSDRVDVFESHLAAAELLDARDVSVSLNYFSTITADSATALLDKLARNVSRESPPAGESVWRLLLADMLRIWRAALVSVIPANTTTEIVAGHALRATRFSLARAVIAGHGLGGVVGEEGEGVPADAARRIVLSASMEFFNSASDEQDEAMKHAYSCLSVLSPDTGDHPDVLTERDLIEAVKLLRKAGCTLLPIQVRLASDRLDVMHQALDESDTLFKEPDLAHRIGCLLKLEEYQVAVAVAQAALNRGDVETAYAVAQPLTGQGSHEAWELFMLLSQASSLDSDTRAIMCANALELCPASKLSTLLEQWRGMTSNHITDVPSFYGTDDIAMKVARLATLVERGEGVIDESEPLYSAYGLVLGLLKGARRRGVMTAPPDAVLKHVMAHEYPELASVSSTLQRLGQAALASTKSVTLLEQGIDVEQWEADDEYRSDVLLNIGRCAKDEAGLVHAIALANRVDGDAWRVVIGYLSVHTESYNLLGVNEIKSALSSGGHHALTMLKQHVNVDAGDVGGHILYHKCVQVCTGQESSVVPFLESLAQAGAAATTMDIETLIDTSIDAADRVKAVATPENAAVLAAVVDTMPNAVLSATDVYAIVMRTGLDDEATWRRIAPLYGPRCSAQFLQELAQELANLAIDSSLSLSFRAEAATSVADWSQSSDAINAALMATRGVALLDTIEGHGAIRDALVNSYPNVDGQFASDLWCVAGVWSISEATLIAASELVGVNVQSSCVSAIDMLLAGTKPAYADDDAIELLSLLWHALGQYECIDVSHVARHIVAQSQSSEVLSIIRPRVLQGWWSEDEERVWLESATMSLIGDENKDEYVTCDAPVKSVGLLLDMWCGSPTGVAMWPDALNHWRTVIPRVTDEDELISWWWPHIVKYLSSNADELIDTVSASPDTCLRLATMTPGRQALDRALKILPSVSNISSDSLSRLTADTGSDALIALAHGPANLYDAVAQCLSDNGTTDAFKSAVLALEKAGLHAHVLGLLSKRYLSTGTWLRNITRRWKQ